MNRNEIILHLEGNDGRVTNLMPIADSIIASLTSDGSITIHRDDAQCLDCGGTDDRHIANYYCPTFRAA